MDDISTTALAYEAPTVTAVGSVREVTQETQVGNYTDKFFPAHTPHNLITLS